MANCVNRNLKEFKDLLELSNYSPVVLGAKIGAWQDSNSTDKIPGSLEELSGTVINSLTDLQKSNLKTIYQESPELQQIGSESDYIEFSKNNSNNNVENFKSFEKSNDTVSLTPDENVQLGEFEINVEIGPDTARAAIRDLKGDYVGEISISFNGKFENGVIPQGNSKKAFIAGVLIEKEFRGKGLGIGAYIQAATFMGNKGYVVSSGIDTSESALRVWESLTNRGYAVKNSDDSYTFINQETEQRSDNVDDAFSLDVNPNIVEDYANQVGALTQGRTLPEGALTELKAQLSNIIYESIKDKKYINNFKFDKETGNMDSAEISAIPSSGKLSSPKRSLASAKRIASDINNKYLHKIDKDKYPIVKVVPTKNGGKLVFGKATRLAIYRGNFAYNGATVTSRLMNEQYKRKAVEMLRLSGKLTVEEYQKIILDNKLTNLSLTIEEMRLGLSEDTKLPMLGATINGDYQESIEEIEDAYNERQANYEQQEQETDDSISFDPDPNDSRTPFNIGKLKEKRESQRKKIESRIKGLEGKRRITGNTKLYTPKIKFLEQVKDRFETEYDNEMIFSDPMEAIRISFQNDIDTIKEMQSSASEDNMFLIKDMIKFLEANINNTTKTFEKENIVSEEISDDISSEVEELMKSFSADLSTILTKQDQIINDLFLEVLKRYEVPLKDLYPGLDLEQIKKELLKKAREDTDIVSGNIGALGNDLTTDDVIGRLIRSEYENQKAVQDAEANPLRQRVDKISEAAKVVLGKMGLTKGNYTNWLEVFARTTDSGDLELISKYSENWKNFVKSVVNNTKSEIIKASKEKNYSKINELYNKKYRELNKDTDFVDLHKLSDLFEVYKDNNEVSDEFEPDAKYTKEIKERLGEEEYESLIERQVNFIEEFLVEKERSLSYMYEKNGVESFDELTEDQKNSVEQAINRIDPFFFASNKDSFSNSVPIEVGSQIYTLPHTLNYNTFIPKESKKEYYDSKYSELSKNDDLFKAWKVYSEAVTAINENLAGSASLDLNKRSLSHVKKELAEKVMGNKMFSRVYKKASNVFPSTLEVIREGSSTQLVGESSSADVNAPNGVASFRSEVSKEYNADKKEIQNILRREINDKSFLTAEDFTLDFQKEFTRMMGITGVELGPFLSKNMKKGKMSVSSIKKLSQAKIFQQQTTDLPKLLKMLLEQSSDYKARENSLRVLEDIIEPATNEVYEAGEGVEEKSRLKKKKETFKTTVLKGQRNTAGKKSSFNFSFSSIFESGGIPTKKSWFSIGEKTVGMSSRNMKPEEHRLHKIYSERIKQIDELLETATNEEIIQDLEKERSSSLDALGKLGMHYTVNSIMEAIGIKAFVNIKLGTNIMSAIMNTSQGRQQNYLQAGFRKENGELVGDYDLNQLVTADAFIKSGVTKKASSKKKKEELEKMSAFIDQLGIVQDGTDFEQRAERSGGIKAPSLNILEKKNRHLMIMTEYVEYYNQTPLILAVSQNYLMPDGSPIFNGNEFPYHELKEGKLVLKKKYYDAYSGMSKEAMMDSYESFTSDKGIKFRTDLKMGIIPKRHGDYSQSGAIVAKTTTFGKTFMVFGNWVYGLLHSAYAGEQSNLQTGKKDWGYISRLIASPEGRMLGLAPVAQNIISAAAVGTMGTIALSSIPYAAAIAAPFIGIGLLLMGKNKVYDAGQDDVTRAEWAMQTMKLLVHGMTVQTAQVGINTVKGVINMIGAGTYKRSSEPNMFDFDYTFGGKLDDVTALALSKASKQQSILNYVSMLHIVSMMVFSGMGAGEEEEELKSDGKLREKQYKKKREKDNYYKAKYLITNMLHRAYDDAVLTTSPQNLIFTLIGEEESSHMMSLPVGGIKALGYGMFGERITDPNSIYFGDTKFSKELRGVLPPMVKNIDKAWEGEWWLGLESSNQKYYRSSLVMETLDDSELKTDKSALAKQRSSARGDLKRGTEYKKAMRSGIQSRLVDKYGKIPEYEELKILDRDLVDKEVNSYVKREIGMTKRSDYTDSQERISKKQIEKSTEQRQKANKQSLRDKIRGLN